MSQDLNIFNSRTFFEKKIKLHLSNIFIEDIIPQINADLVALKVPLNCDLNSIIKTSQYDKIFFYKIYF